MLVAPAGPPCVVASMTPKVSKNAYTMFTTSRKNVVGDRSGKTIVQNRRPGPAPSIAAASISDLGIDCSPARKNRKLYEIWFQTAATTTSVIASWATSSGSQGMPKPLIQCATTPSVGLNRNSHSTAATACATAYGQMSSVLYTPAKRSARSAYTA